MARKAGTGSLKFGWCAGFEIELNHEACKAEYIASTDSANYKIGDTVSCQCECHERK